MLWALKVQNFDDTMFFDLSDAKLRVPDDFRPLALLELETHEHTEAPQFSVCKYLLETAAPKINKEHSWNDIAKHIAAIRETLPEHVRSACDAFIKHNKDDIVSFLQTGDIAADLVAVAAETETNDSPAQPGQTTDNTAADASQQELFKKFWEEKGKFCGACLTMTKKLQKWLNLNCTQAVITERLMRMCSTMPEPMKSQCEGSEIWIKEFVLKQLFKKISLPNHCAYIGLCEKTMVIRALQNPMVMSDHQNSLIQDIEGANPNLFQEGETVLQQPHDTPTTAPEITFDLSQGGVSYRDVDRSTGARLPKVFIDGSRAPSDALPSFLETESQSQGIFDLSNPQDPHVTINAQDEDLVHVPIMHQSLNANLKMPIDKKNYGLQGNHLPIETKFLKGCAACQFAVGGIFEFMSNPRTIRTLLPAVKQACNNCNNPEEVQKCQDFIEVHGVAFYQDVLRQGIPSKWCPRIELCEIQYFHPSPFVLSDTYNKVQDQMKQVSDF